MSIDLYLPFICSIFLFIMYKTDAFVEYIKLFRLGNLFFIPDYEAYLERQPASDYWSYLRVKSDSYFTRLLECPVCMAAWLNIISLLYGVEWRDLFVHYWISLALYFLLSVLMNKAYER